MDRHETGVRGEDLAAEYLTNNGHSILHRNWRSGRYELDLVTMKDQTLHIVEVKSRRMEALTSPEDAMTRNKFNSLCHAVRNYIDLHHMDMDVQFDLIAVEFDHHEQQLPQLRYIPNVMTPRW